MAEAFIVAAARTAGGRRGGRLAGWHPADLAAQVLDALVARTGADPALIEDVIMGSSAGRRHPPHRAMRLPPPPDSVPGTRSTTSALLAACLHFARMRISGSRTRDRGRVESMTRCPGFPDRGPKAACALHSPAIRSLPRLQFASSPALRCRRTRFRAGDLDLRLFSPIAPSGDLAGHS